MENIKLEIVGLSYSQTQTGAYALVLGESYGNRRLPIIIGGYEAQAIAIELEDMKPGRPLTHDLFQHFVQKMLVSLKEVIIYNLVEGIFYSKLIFLKDDESEVILDSRTSDAVALAVRFKCPIYTTQDIMDTAGIILDAESENEEEELQEEEIELPQDILDDPYEEMSLSDLQELLSEAIANEDYEKASKLRDTINSRSK